MMFRPAEKALLALTARHCIVGVGLSSELLAVLKY